MARRLQELPASQAKKMGAAGASPRRPGYQLDIPGLPDCIAANQSPMNFPRRLLLLAALGLTLGALPESPATDPGIGTQLSKIKHALNNEKGPDLKRLRAAASSLTQKLPAALAQPSAPDSQAYQVDSAEVDGNVLADPVTPPELTLTDDQRETLINAYQDYANKIDALARQDPFNGQVADQIVGAVATLDHFMTKLNQLVPMKRSSVKYLNAISALVAEERQKRH
jgi:hypothetical protein